MPTYREVNTGQVVEIVEPPFYLDGLARWERIEEVGLSAPETPTEYSTPGYLGLNPGAGAPVPFPESEPETAQAAADEEQADDAVAVPAVDAPRAEWVAYAKSQGKTDADLKGKKVDTIRDWYITD